MAVPPPRPASGPATSSSRSDGRPIAGVGDLQRSLVGDLVDRPVGVSIERDGALIELDVRPVELAGVTARLHDSARRGIVASGNDPAAREDRDVAGGSNMNWDPEAWTRDLIADMRAHGGRPSSGPMAGKTLVILTSTGAKTGEPRDRDRRRITAMATLGDRRLEGRRSDEHPRGTTTSSPIRTRRSRSTTRSSRSGPRTPGRRARSALERPRRCAAGVRRVPSKTDRVIPMFVLERVPQPATTAS